MEATNQLQLYSISAAAKVLHLGKDAMYKLVADGKIGYIEIGKRKKIPYQELVRFQNESLTKETNGTSHIQSMTRVLRTILHPTKNQPLDLDINSFIINKLQDTKWQSSELETT